MEHHGKVYIKIIFCFLFVQTILFQNKLSAQEVDSFKVNERINIEIIDIDSTKDYFIIYAIASEKRFKIVTRKDSFACKNVFVKEKYIVTLTSMNDKLPIFLQGLNTCDVHYNFGIDNVILNEPEWGCDIYLVDEIFGLCYTTDKDEIDRYKQWVEKNPILPHSLRCKSSATSTVKTKKVRSKK